ncbi:MAG: FecR domain-containing protein [Xanthomonadaceae bacterium]|nr:FecR domain-containing protein [Xanthomonadaceae bacterium]
MNQTMYDTAAQWQLRLEAGPLGPDEDAALSAWLAADVRHRIALAEAGMAWHGSVQAHPDATIASAKSHAAPRAPRRAWIGWLAGAAAAPALALALLAAPGWWAVLRSDAHAAVGAQASLALPDGSRAIIDSDGAIAFDFDGDRREVSVLRGAAWFEVVPDPARPFRVRAGDTTATALGTAYAVDRRGDAVDVVVTHGVVEVALAGQAPVRVEAGQASHGGAAATALDARQAAATAWREGLLSFSAEPLADALARLDRYLPQRVVLLDDARATEPVSAVFPLADAALAVDALARSHGLRVRRLPGLLLVGG